MRPLRDTAVDTTKMPFAVIIFLPSHISKIDVCHGKLDSSSRETDFAHTCELSWALASLAECTSTSAKQQKK